MAEIANHLQLDVPKKGWPRWSNCPYRVSGARH